MLYYKLIHVFLTRRPRHVHFLSVGIYSSREKAESAKRELADKPGFCGYPKAFRILPVLRIGKPILLDRTFWTEGFEPYYY